MSIKTGQAWSDKHHQQHRFGVSKTTADWFLGIQLFKTTEAKGRKQKLRNQTDLLLKMLLETEKVKKAKHSGKTAMTRDSSKMQEGIEGIMSSATKQKCSLSSVKGKQKRVAVMNRERTCTALIFAGQIHLPVCVHVQTRSATKHVSKWANRQTAGG